MCETLPPSHWLLLDLCRAMFIVFDLEKAGHIAADIADPGSQDTLILCSIGLPLSPSYTTRLTLSTVTSGAH
jgi:hypothetical protein